MFAAAYPKPSFASPFVDALENHHQYIKSHNNKVCLSSTCRLLHRQRQHEIHSCASVYNHVQPVVALTYLVKAYMLSKMLGSEPETCTAFHTRKMPPHVACHNHPQSFISTSNGIKSCCFGSLYHSAQLAQCMHHKVIFVAAGYCQNNPTTACSNQPTYPSPFLLAPPFSPQEKNFVDISMDLLQYMSEGLEAACNSLQAACQPQATACCPLDAYPSLGSGCSAHSNQMEPESPTYKQHTQQSPASSPSSSSSTCHTDTGPTPASSTPSSSSSSAGSADMEQQLKASSCQSYDDNFVWQCYFGDPNSAVNKQQQRPKQVSPFAAFATFPGYSL
mgnify:FL=1